jgi:putative ABC transport system permease protein
METFLQDVRFGLRTLRKRPLFTLMAIGTLGLGIGATTAIFSVVNGVLFLPPPFDEPSELVSVWQTYPEWREESGLADMWDWGYLSYPGYERWRAGQTHFQDVAIHNSTYRNFSGQGDPERIAVGVASSSLFGVLGVEPAIGRAFRPEEDVENGPRVALLSHAFWRERFGEDPEILGRTITLNQSPFTVVGVLPKEFKLRGLGFLGSTGEKPVWIPVGADGQRRREGNHGYEAIARLRAGATIEQATPEAVSLISAPDEEPGHGVRMVPWQELERAGIESPLFLLLGASLVLLLIACANVATLLLGESTSRHHEMATRAALGAGSRRIVRQLLTESIFLGVAGSALGIVFALVGTRILLSAAPPLPRLDLVRVDPTVLFFGVGLGVLTGVLFGLAPAWTLTGGRVKNALGTGGRSGPRRGSSLQRMVVAAELALTVVLLVSGALLAQSLDELMSVDTGFQRESVVMVRVYLPSYIYGEQADRAALAERMRQALSEVPGVVAASGTSSLPFYNSPNALSYGVEGMEVPEALSPHASLRNVLPGFFETMGIRILEGRGILDTDRVGSRPVAVISETMAQRHWPDSSALGARILFGETLEVVGVAADVVHESLDAEPLATMYVPYLWEAGTSINFVVRAKENPEALFAALRQAVRSVDRDAPISRVATLPDLISDSAREERFRTVLMVVFAICATLLAGAGVFGVTARSVAQRTKELGIRKALGAESGRLVLLALSGTLQVGLAGIGLGLLGAFWSSRLLGQFLFGIEAWDLGTYLLMAASLLVLSALASYLPARRAGRVSPMEVLREGR